MSELHLPDLSFANTQLRSGIWEGLLTGREEKPQLSVTYLNEEVQDVSVTKGEADATWLVRVPIPVACIADGLHTVLIKDSDTETRLASISLIAGEALGDDLRADVDLLRAELDMLKRAFRRHCVETT